ncbi:hypothetical protein HNQ34_002193 [Anoxybacillus tepidamans]|uniref:Uncharacterized protein n=1 Tax=Anoxybacteroides tepidamans TaxID=265948 RepID=A0A7W8MVB1_9BACL|nr:hypothetical protein [Anoxybacillus tepidamans]MBB5325094.1 hypothetical protein [Anoxybacillus tepidamans]
MVKLKRKHPLLLLFGSMPPKSIKSARKWDQIRKQAREGHIHQKYGTSIKGT